MATIRKRGNSYQIRVSCRYDTSGNQVVQTVSWKPADGMNKKQIEKELQKQAILFEDKCMKGQVTAISSFRTLPSSGLRSMRNSTSEIRPMSV